MYQAIYPGKPWLDTEGKRIQAHGGSVIHIDGTYYWYGENKEKTMIYGDPVSGWPSTICIIFFVSGIQLFCTGIIGAYLSKTYLETKKRPIYIIKETEKKD